MAALLTSVLAASSPAATIDLVSEAYDWGTPDGGVFYVNISADGRYALFTSQATNLTNDDHNGRTDVFVVQILSNVSHLLSANPVTGAQDESGQDCSIGDISGDGRYVVFNCYDTGAIVSGYTKPAGWTDVILYDRDTSGGGTFDQPGTRSTRVVSVAADGQPLAFCSSGEPTLSDDGRFVAFSSNCRFEVGDTGNNIEIYVHDRDTDEDGVFDEAGAISTVHATTSLTAESSSPQLSGDGSTVVYRSEAAMDAADTNAVIDLYAYGVADASLELLSVAVGGGAADGASSDPKVSHDGRYVLFTSDATNLVAGDTNGLADVFLRDRILDTTTRVSRSGAGAQLDHASQAIAVSADGNLVYFGSNATNLPGARALAWQQYRFDRRSGQVDLMTPALFGGGLGGDHGSSWADVAADGRYMVVGSDATDLVESDPNGVVADVFAVNTAVDLGISLTEADDPVAYTNGLHYSFTLRNLETLGATGVDVTFLIPPGTVFSSASLAGQACTLNDPYVECKLGGLSRGGTATGSIVLTTSAPGDYILSSMVAAEQDEMNQNDNYAYTTTTAATGPDLAVTLSAPSTVKKGKTFMVGVTVRNLGSTTVTTGTVQIAPPVNGSMSKASKFTLNGATCAKASRPPLTCTISGLAPGAQVTGTMTIKAKAVGVTSETVSASVSNDFDPTNNTTKVAVTVTK